MIVKEKLSERAVVRMGLDECIFKSEE